MLFRNFYRCAACGRDWTDVWSAQCDDDCPHCGARHMSPHKSEDVEDPKRSNTIATINDAFRRSFFGGKVMMTAGVNALPDMVKASALQQAAAFDEFTADNDPYGEHDFGGFELCSRKFLWKIDYYDAQCKFGSEDPADPAKTTRVLTLMLAEEY
jgi:predicted  nucleic acid-binding Zn-ribbon protein